jgi:hypothetical protein
MKTRFLATTVAAGFALLAMVGAASASPAQITQNTNVLNGDGGVIGSLSAGTSVDMEYCANGNCRVNGGGLRGWVPQGVLAAAPAPAPQPPSGGGGGGNNNNGPSFSFDFGFGNPPPRPPRYNPPPRRNAEVCFYERTNFRGRSFCVGEGEADNRLSQRWNDSISSITIDRGLTVEVCSDNRMRGTCADIDRDVSRLPRSLDDRISSYQVY